MIKSGINNGYYWVEIPFEIYQMDDLISTFPDFIINKCLAIVSFDSDSFLPTKTELKRGWVYENEIAYFDYMTPIELNQNAIFDIYDQWLIFDKKQRFKEMDIFVNYVGFSIDTDEKRNKYQKLDTNKFWSQIHSIKPQKFILNGEKLIFGTNNKSEFEKVENWIK